MVNFTKRILDNGLTVIVHEDTSTPLVAVNVLYKVGSKDEPETKTGFAHLFEHLMFGGSANAPDFDGPIQLAGGENNAFTNSDITNYYITIPASNLETALWLESDRMQHLIINENTLEVQRKVVVEEFKETCLNKPYGDLWHLVSDLSFTKHPYKWPTIGKDISHIVDAKLSDVTSFFKSYYVPNNAILVMAGNIEVDKGMELAQKWFGDIPKGETITRNSISEPEQLQARKIRHQKDVPSKAIFVTFHMPGKSHPDFYIYDLISDILSNGRSSRLFRSLHKEQRLFSKIDAYITGTLDPGLLIIEGRLSKGTSVEKGIKAIWQELELIKSDHIPDNELQKIKNQAISTMEFNEITVLSKAMNIAYFESVGDADLINKQRAGYDSVSVEDIKRVANTIFLKDRSNILIYGEN